MKNLNEILEKIEEEKKLIDKHDTDGYLNMMEGNYLDEPFIRSRMANDRIMLLKWIIGEIDIWID
jgi:hypothetical protein